MKITRAFFLTVLVIFATASVFAQDSGEPGSYENAAPAGMEKILEVDNRLKPSDDEFVIYYLRPDKKYDGWGLWIWARPGGEGEDIWPYTQKWSVDGDVAYLRLKKNGSSTGGKRFIADDGGIGMIVRKVDGWTKDGREDRLWNINDYNRVAIFSLDDKTYSASEYKPSIESAKLVTPHEITLTLSGRFGLDVDGGFSGFSVTDSDGKEYKIAKVYNTNKPKNPELNMTSDVTIVLAENANVVEKLIVKNPQFFSDAAVSNTDLAIEIANSKIPSKETVLGCTLNDGTAEFNLWAPTSSSATVNIYKIADAAKPDYTVDMTMNDKTGVWSAVFDAEDPDGFFYDYTLKNSKGIVTVLDPYALSMAAFNGSGAGRGAIVNLTSEKAGVQDEPYIVLEKREDAIIYEMSVRDFTISPDSGGKEMPGTYKAFIEKIPYLKDMGITHVQLMPVVNFYYTDENNKKYESSGTVGGNNYNWGYDPHNYFTPEGWYATDAADPYCRIRELRELINECHKAGIGVLLDVVYNHMANTSFLDDIVPGYYFRLSEGGGFLSNSGCGNDTATERPMMKRLVVDSTTHWVKNYKADGFRFDLMGLMESSSVEDSYAACAKLDKSVLFVGEGWKMYNGRAGTVGLDQNYMLKTNNIACFNDEFRDLMKAGGFNETGRGLITKKATDGERFFHSVTGNPIYNFRVDQPGDSLNYLVCHDGLTLHDAVVHNLKLDEKNDRKEIISRIKLGNFIVFTSQGIAFMHGGQERGRTKPNVKNSKSETIGAFVRNSYDSSDNINQFVWTIDDDYQGLLDYTKGLIEIRKAFPIFRMGNAKAIAKNIKDLEIDDASGLVFAYTIKDKKNMWLVAINANSEKKEINIGVSLKNGVIYIDSEVADKNGISNPKGVEISGNSVVLDPLTATLIRIK